MNPQMFDLGLFTFADMTPADLNAFFGGEPLTKLVSLAMTNPAIVRIPQYAEAIKTQLAALASIHKMEEEVGWKIEEILPKGSVMCYTDHVVAIDYISSIL